MQRKRHTPDFKAKVVLEALKGTKTINERYVLSWEISNTLDVHFCSQALETALAQGTPEIPEIFNTGWHHSPLITRIHNN